MLRHVPAISRAKSPVYSLPERTQECGFHVDNWVESRLRISRPKRELGSVSYLQGVSPVQQRVEIRVDGKVVSAKKLAEGSRERIELLLPNEDISLLEFVFSAHSMSLCSRKLAFSVEATNLFSEQDLQG